MTPNDAGDQVLKFHDPLILKERHEEGDRYFCFSTDTNIEGVQISVSDDLVNWKLHCPALAEIPDEVVRHTGRIPSGPRHGQVNFWAPEVVVPTGGAEGGGEYRLYFCSSMFGVSQSMIGLAVSAAIDGPYQYRGCVLKTYHTGRFDSPNAIDPCVARDRDGLPYLVYGSFFGGIYIAPLDADGFMSKPGYGKRIAGGEHRPVEGAYILYDTEGDRFCLFVSYGSLLRDYRICLAYSGNIEGPYFDSAGHEMTNLDPVLSVGDKIAGGYNFDIPGTDGFMAPGHNSLLLLDDGWYMTHHIRREGVLDPSYLHIRKVFFTKTRQIFVSPVPGKIIPAIPGESDLTGNVSVVRHDPFNNGVTYGRKMKFSDLNLRRHDEECSLNLYNTDYEGRIFIQDGIVYFSAISVRGECVWGRSY
jgi:arabinan endo-1,5-alpha-L-arabinosidase